MKNVMIGHFALNTDLFIGQTIKTKNIYNELIKDLKFKKTKIIDTHKWNDKKILLLSSIIFMILKSKNIILVISQEAMESIFFLVKWFRIFKNKRFHYVVVGGDLPQKLYLDNSKIKLYSTLYQIYVETETMKTDLNNLGLNNTSVLYNFKELVPVNIDSQKFNNIPPYKLCTFSRVVEGKGIKEAIESIVKVNEKFSKDLFQLDIYGQIDFEYQNEFESIIHKCPQSIKYMGIVKPENSIDTIKNYFALLFPTKFFYEGFPGTILDAFFAGVPVISSRWNTYKDLIVENITGRTFEFNNFLRLEEILIEVANNPAKFTEMKLNCLKETEKYLPGNAIKTLVNRL